MNIIVGINKQSLIGRVFCGIFAKKVFAEEQQDDTTNQEGSESKSVNFEDLIAKARSDEKKKHYKTIEDLKKQIATLTEQHNKDLLVVGDKDNIIADLQGKLKNSGSADTKKFEEEIASLNATIATLKQQVGEYESKPVVKEEEVEQRVRTKLEAEYEVKLYKTQQLAEHKDDILVPELVFGETKEEIDTSIQAAITRSEEIKKSLGYTGKQKRTPKTTSPSTDEDGMSQVSIEQLASMDVKSPEYAELRKKLGLY